MTSVVRPFGSELPHSSLERLLAEQRLTQDRPWNVPGGSGVER